MSTENDTPNPDNQGEPELGDAGKRAIAAERTRADAAERQVRSLQGQIDTLQGQVAELESTNTSLASDVESKNKEITRLNVGIDKKLPKSLIARLQGDDEDTLAADADALLEFLPADAKPALPKADPSQGPKADVGKTSTAQQFADSVNF